MAEGAAGTVLILEDDQGVARLQQRRLERAGYAVVTAGSPDEALAQIRGGRPDLLLLDYRLAGQVDGLEFHAQLRADGHNLPVILVTGFSDDATVIRALRAGVRDFVTKSPAYLDYLPESVGRVLKQVRTEEQLAASEARLAAVINAALDGILVAGADGRVTLLNPAAERIFRRPAREAVGLPVDHLIPAGLQATGPAAGGWAAHEARGRRADGEEFPLELSSAQAEVAGQPFSVLVVRDITARKQAEEALAETNRSLERALAELRTKADEIQAMTQQLWQAAKLASVGELAASIAHELNNPLATVTLRVEAALARTPAGDPRRRPLEVVEQEVRRMAVLVANLLQFTRPGANQASTVDVEDELRKALDLVQHYLRQRDVRVALELGPDVPPIYADRQKLLQVFLNVLTNAADAMPEGGTLTLRARPGALGDGTPAVALEFADTGVGIPPEALPRVAEPFFTTKPEGKGTGLGLAICRRIVQEHHGAIEILSEVGKGTTVRVVLPVPNGTN
jgi:PAS domain S-box-containing protein